MSIIIVALIASAILLAVISVVAHSQAGAAGVCGVAALATLFFVCGMSPALLLQAVLTLLVAVCACVGRKSPAFVTRGSLAAMVISYVVVVTLSLPSLRETANLRQEYPLVSLADRLAYEDRLASSPERNGALHETALSDAVESQLQKSESEDHWHSRRWMLESLHNRTADQFVLAQGFGISRMMGVHRGRVDLPEAEPIPLPEMPDYSPSDPLVQPLAARQWAGEGKPPEDVLRSMHFNGSADFVDAARTGYARDRQHVAGFQSHQFSRVPIPHPDQTLPAAWQVSRLELISLLKHDKPVAYVSKHLPRMDELAHAPTRPLSGAEVEALVRLRSDEDVVIVAESRRIQMVGSLRASSQCMKCHSVGRGDLLGALSYELIPAGAAEPPASDQPLEPQASIFRRGMLIEIE